MIVDSHCHVSERWFEPVETLLSVMDRAGVERAVLTQLLNEYDNSYFEQCRRRYPDRLSLIVGVDPSREDAVAALVALADAGARGVRLRATARSAGDDPIAVWRAADALGLVVSCPGSAADFSSVEFAALVASLPKLRIVLEHLAASSRPDASDEEAAARRAAFGLARFDNVSIKVHGLGEVTTRAMPLGGAIFTEERPAVLMSAYEAFGAARMMWGSDFPPVAGREGYGNALAGPRAAFSELPAGERELIFGGSASAAFF